MKKVWSLLLCMALLLPMLPSIGAQAAETIIFADDFESCDAGGTIAVKASTAQQWSGTTTSQTSTVTVAEVDGTKVLQLTNSAEKFGAPACRKTLFLLGIKTLHISYKVRVTGDANANFTFYSGSDLVFRSSANPEVWTAYTLVCDFEKGTYTRYKDGAVETTATFNTTPDDEVSLRFAGSVNNNNCVYYDDIVLSTPDAVDVNLLETGGGQQRTIAQYAQIAENTYKGEAAPTPELPTGAIALFSYDNNAGGERINTGTDATWTKVQTKDTLKATAVSKNELIMTINPKITKTSSSLMKTLNLGDNAKDLTIVYHLYFIGDGATTFALTSADGNAKLIDMPTIEATDLAITDGWNTFRYEMDFEAGKYTAYLNDTVLARNTAFASTSDDYSKLSLTLTMTPYTLDTFVLLDNVLIYTNTPITYDTMLYGTEGVNWDLVKGEPITQASFVSNLRPHPRLLVTDWKEINQKINTNKMCAEWYASIKTTADRLLTASNVPYTFDNGRNWLAGARNVRERLTVLAFVYGITGERKYIDRALEEMRFAATHPDWSNTAPIIPAECMMGYAIAYDWMYHGLTDAEKAEIRKIICDKALWQYIHSYAGNISVEIDRGVSNRTIVANSCGLTTAIAIADEMPEVANYVYKNALKYTMPAIEEYNDDGGFPEGTGYWEYASRFTVLLMDALKTAPVEGYVHDADAQWFFERESLKNTPKYNIYLNSGIKMFNYGDAGEGVKTSPTLYWFADYCDEPFYQQFEDDLLEKHQLAFTQATAVQALVWYNPDMQLDNAADMPKDIVFNSPDAAAATMRASFTDNHTLFAGMQGGDNTTGHMYPSLGHFVIDANGQRFINTVIPGVDYSAEFENAYYYSKRTEGQNTILFNPDASVGQEKQAQAIFTDFQADDDEAFTILDMTQTHKHIESAKRGMYMTRGRKSVIIQDEFTMKIPSEVYWFAQTQAAITLAPDKKSALLQLGGEEMLVVLKQAPAGATLSIMEAKPLPTSPTAVDEKYNDYFKLAVHATNVTEGTISVEFIPLAAGEAPTTARQTAFLPIEQWALDTTVPMATAADAFGSSVALKIGSPVAFASGRKAYVDPENSAIMPFTENGRTLVPVRFISEKMGGDVSWEASTQKVTIRHGVSEIILHLGQQEMYVNGEVKLLDVPATAVGGRTVIPLRAMAEAIGKSVFWDDRGLILISDAAQTPSEEEINKMLTLLDTRVLIGDSEFTAFTPDTTAYYVTPQGAVRVVSGGAELPVVQTADAASFTLAGNPYTLTFAANPFDGAIGTGSDAVVSTLDMEMRVLQSAQAQEKHYIEVASAEMSTGHDKYISTGTIDNVINNELINRWSGYGSGAYIIYDFGKVQNVHSFGLATLNGDRRYFIFALQISDDGETWTEILKTNTSGTTTLFDIFKLGDVQARYVKVIGYGDSGGGLYNSWTEVRFWKDAAQEQADKEVWKNGLGDGKAYHIGDVLKLDVAACNAKGTALENASVTFSTDKEGIVSIAADGTVTVIGAGEVCITASLHNGFKTLESSVELICQ